MKIGDIIGIAAASARAGTTVPLREVEHDELGEREAGHPRETAAAASAAWARRRRPAWTPPGASAGLPADPSGGSAPRLESGDHDTAGGACGSPSFFSMLEYMKKSGLAP